MVSLSNDIKKEVVDKKHHLNSFTQRLNDRPHTILKVLQFFLGIREKDNVETAEVLPNLKSQSKILPRISKMSLIRCHPHHTQ